MRDRPDPAFKEYEHTYHRVAQLNRRECTASLACTHTKQKDERASPSPSISLLTPPQDQRQVGKKHPAKLSSLSQPNHPRCTTTTTPKRPCLRSARSQKQSRQGAKKPTSPRAAQRALGFHTPLDPAWARRDQRKSGSSPQSTQVGRDRCVFPFSGSLLERTCRTVGSSLERVRPPSHVASFVRDSSARPAAAQAQRDATQRSNNDLHESNRTASQRQQQEKLRLVFPDVALVTLFRCFSF